LVTEIVAPFASVAVPLTWIRSELAVPGSISTS
jgi:hypothetical protein